MSRYKELIRLLKIAKGDRSLNRFAEDSGVDAGHLSRVIRGMMVKPPSPETLKKIADKAQNGVTYEQLMIAAGHLEKNFYGANLTLLRGERSYEEYSTYLKKNFCINISPVLLERYEKGLECPDEVVAECIASAEGLPENFFYTKQSAASLHVRKRMNQNPFRKSSFMDKEIEKWVNNPDSYPYIKFIYEAFKAGITPDLLKNAEISIKIK
mgnify:FL=1